MQFTFRRPVDDDGAIRGAWGAQGETVDIPGSLAGKVAVVTGSTQGLGEATARLFASRGASGLLITGRNEQRGHAVAASLDSATCKAVFVPADIAQVAECGKLIAAADACFGRLDVLVNVAALTERGSIWDTPPDRFDRIMATNVRAPFYLMQNAIKLMERGGVGGSIVNISSIVAHGSMPMLAAYATSKAALNVLTKNTAYAVMRRRIRVNALNLGWMDTPAEDAIQRSYHGAGEHWLSAAEARQPFGRLLKPIEVARAIAFLASEESGMMTGAIIDFDQSVSGSGPQPIPPPIEQWEAVTGVKFS